MTGYLINFIVYTSAMIGIIFLALFVYKNFSVSTKSKSKFLDVEDCISLAPRKNLYVVKAGNERFLIASDADRTNLISKLGADLTENREIVRRTIAESEVADINQARQPRKVFKDMMSKL